MKYNSIFLSIVTIFCLTNSFLIGCSQPLYQVRIGCTIHGLNCPVPGYYCDPESSVNTDLTRNYQSLSPVSATATASNLFSTTTAAQLNHSSENSISLLLKGSPFSSLQKDERSLEDTLSQITQLQKEQEAEKFKKFIHLAYKTAEEMGKSEEQYSKENLIDSSIIFAKNRSYNLSQQELIDQLKKISLSWENFENEIYTRYVKAKEEKERQVQSQQNPFFMHSNNQSSHGFQVLSASDAKTQKMLFEKIYSHAVQRGKINLAYSKEEAFELCSILDCNFNRDKFENFLIQHSQGQHKSLNLILQEAYEDGQRQAFRK